MSHIFAAAKAVITHNNKFLVIKQNIHGTEIWDLPGGRIA